MKPNRVVSPIACRAASLPYQSALLPKLSPVRNQSALRTYCIDLLLALLTVAAVSLLAALLLALLSAAPARADIAPSFWYVAPGVDRRLDYIGPTQICIMDEDVKVYVHRRKNSQHNCEVVRTLTLKNCGKRTYTEQIYVPADSFYVDHAEDDLRVRINGKLTKVDVIPPDMLQDLGPATKYYRVRLDGWPMKFAPGQTITLQVSTSEYSVGTGRRQSWLTMNREWTDEKEQAFVHLDPQTVSFWCDYPNEWRIRNGRQRVTFILLDGLTIDNVAEMHPGLTAVNNHTLAWETTGGKAPDSLTLKIRFEITKTQLAARYEKLHAKHPKNSTIVAELGEVYESQGLFSKQLKLYQDFMVAHPVRPDKFEWGGFWTFRKAWVKYTDRTHNQHNAYIVAPILAKVLEDTEKKLNNEPTALKWYRQYLHPTTGHATTRHATARHATTRHATTRHATTRHATTRHATARHATTGHATTRIGDSTYKLNVKQSAGAVLVSSPR